MNTIFYEKIMVQVNLLQIIETLKRVKEFTLNGHSLLKKVNGRVNMLNHPSEVDSNKSESKNDEFNNKSSIYPY